MPIDRTRLRGSVECRQSQKKVVGVYERESGNRCGRYRRAVVDWVEKMRVLRRTGVLPASAKPKKVAPQVQKDGVVTVDTLCSAFQAYVKSHPEEYRDQKERAPPNRGDS
jgi:hypothetical protein